MVTYVSLDPDEFQALIDDLNSFYTQVDWSVQVVINDNRPHDYPLSLDLGTFYEWSDIDRCDLVEEIEDLQARLDAAKAANESGVAFADPDGTMYYYIPDDAQDTADNATTYNNVAIVNQARADANTLVNVSSDCSPEEWNALLARMQEHQDDIAYANAVIANIGPDKLVEVPIRAQERTGVSLSTGENITDLLGSLLATASTSWPPSRADQIASIIVSSVDEYGEWGRISALNAILGDHDHDGNHVNDLEFSSAFLVSMGEKLERISWNEIYRNASGSVAPSNIGDEAEKAFRDHFPGSFDPLAGVLDAMGNNPTAALRFLGPPQSGKPTDSDADTTRLETLSAQNWDQAGFAGFTAAIAAASSLRNHPSDGASSRASEVSGTAIHCLAQNTTVEMNEDAKARIGVLIANCPDEVTAAWGYGIHGVSGNADALISVSAAEQLGTATVSDLDALTSRVADSADATATISASLADYAARRSKTGVSAHRDDPDQQIDAIVGAYGSGATAEAHLVGIADVRAKDKTAEEISKATELNGSASTAITAFSTVAAGGFSALPSPAGVALSTTVSTVSTLVAPVAADALVGDPQTASSPVSLQLSDSMMAAAAQDAAQAGLINQDSYQVGPTEENPDIQTAADQYSWVVDDGHGGHTIDLSGTSKEDLAGVNTWATQVADPNRVDQIPPDPRLVRLKDAIDDAAARGWVRGSSSTVDHGTGG